MPLVEWLEPLASQYGYPAVLAFVALESAGLPVPGETLLVLAAIFAGRGALDIRAVLALASLGAIAGDACGYWVGRRFGFPLLLRYGARIGLDEGRVKVAQYLFLRHGGKIVFFGRFVSLLRMLSPLLAGANRMAWPRFLAFNAAGGIVWALSFGLGGYALGLAFEHFARPAGVAALVVVILAAIGAGSYAARHEQRLREEAERALPGPLRPK